MLHAKPPVAPAGAGQGEPPWLTIILAVITAIVTLGGGYLTYLATRRDPPATEQGSPPQMPSPPQVREMPKTADEQLDFARELVAEIKADRDKLARQLEAANRRLAEQDALIERLQSVIDAWSRQAPPPPPPHAMR